MRVSQLGCISRGFILVIAEGFGAKALSAELSYPQAGSGKGNVQVYGQL